MFLMKQMMAQNSSQDRQAQSGMIIEPNQTQPPRQLTDLTFQNR